MFNTVFVHVLLGEVTNTQVRRITSLLLVWPVAWPRWRRRRQLERRKNLTWQRVQHCLCPWTPRWSNQHSSKKNNQLAVGVTGGVTKMADKMAAPTPTRKEEDLNVVECSTPPMPMDSSATSQGPSIPSPADITTDHSPEGEWKEVVSKKTRKKLSVRTQDHYTTCGRTTSYGLTEEDSIITSEEEAGEVTTSGSRQGEADCGTSTRIPTSWKVWPRWSGYWPAAGLVRHYPSLRQTRREEKYNVDLPAYCIHFLGNPTWYLAKGPTSNISMERTTTILRGDSSGLLQLATVFIGSTTWTTAVKAPIRQLSTSWRSHLPAQSC